MLQDLALALRLQALDRNIASLENEIAYAEGEIRKSEDKILELMEQSERLEKNVKAAEAAFKQESQHVEGEKTRARDRTAIDQKELADRRAERKSITDEMNPKIYAE